MTSPAHSAARRSRRGSPSSLSHTIENFARRLRNKFRAAIEGNPAQFKRLVVRLLRRNLPPQPGRPCSHAVTRAFRLRARKASWPRIYRVCLPVRAGARDRFNLRVAVRMRRLRLRNSRYTLAILGGTLQGREVANGEPGPKAVASIAGFHSKGRPKYVSTHRAIRYTLISDCQPAATRAQPTALMLDSCRVGSRSQRPKLMSRNPRPLP